MRRKVSDCPAPSVSVFVVTGAISSMRPSCASADCSTFIGQPWRVSGLGGTRFRASAQDMAVLAALAILLLTIAQCLSYSSSGLSGTLA